MLYPEARDQLFSLALHYEKLAQCLEAVSEHLRTVPAADSGSVNQKSEDPRISGVTGVGAGYQTLSPAPSIVK